VPKFKFCVAPVYGTYPPPPPPPLTIFHHILSMALKMVSLAVTVPDVATNPSNVVFKTLAVVKYNRVPSAIADVLVPVGN